jgi:hypothetical protein
LFALEWLKKMRDMPTAAKERWSKANVKRQAAIVTMQDDQQADASRTLPVLRCTDVSR